MCRRKANHSMTPTEHAWALFWYLSPLSDFDMSMDANSSAISWLRSKLLFNEATKIVIHVNAATQVCCWICAAMSFLPRAAIRRLFPPMVPGVVIFLVSSLSFSLASQNGFSRPRLYQEAQRDGPQTCMMQIGASLIGSAFNNWGGGAACSEPTSTAYSGCQIPTGPGGSLVNGTCYGPETLPNCFGNGSVSLPFGSPQYLGKLCFLYCIL